MEALTSPAIVPFLLRWAHVMFGILWLGHLFFLNLVNIPFQRGLDADLKPRVNPALLLRVLYWFRTGAMYTFIFGWALFIWLYLTPERNLVYPEGGMSHRGMWVLFGAVLGSVMWFNVWFIMWPRQKKLLGALAAGTTAPDAEALMATSTKVSRLNTFLSGPMLFGMIAPTHFTTMSTPVLILVLIVGVGFWQGMLKRSFKVKTTIK